MVLWDVDKTLVDVSGVSREIYAVAFEKVGDLAAVGAAEVFTDLTSPDALAVAVYDRLLGSS